MTDSASALVIGAGQAGGELAAALRSHGYDGQITVVGAESAPPYTRPPLSKAYLLGTASYDEVMVRTPGAYDQLNIELRLGVEVTSIDRQSRRVSLADGSSLGYSKLVLATGGRARRLPVPALEAASNVHYIRTLEDADRLRAGFVAGARLIVIGGGYVGLEIASVAQRRGLTVTVLEIESRLLARVAEKPVSDFFERVHAEEGVDIRLNASISDYSTDAVGDITAIRLQDGSCIGADLVVVGVGLVPNTELAQAAGLEVNNGIVVDDHLRTSDPDVYAIGDVASYPDAESGTLMRLESVPNALSQAQTVAEAIAGSPHAHSSVPWFWSDQYDVKLQLVGLTAGCDEIVVRGDMAAGRQFAAFHLKHGAVRAAAIANSPREFAAARKLVAERAVIDPARLADTSIPPRELLLASTKAGNV